MRAEGAESCPAPNALRAAVARRLGRDPFDRDAATSFEVLVQRAQVGWTATIVARGAPGEQSGERTLSSDAESCASLADAISLAIALAIDPEAVERVARQPAEPPTPALPVPAPAPAAPAPERVQHEDPPPAAAIPAADGWIDARALAALGLLPGGAPGFGLGGDAQLASLLSAFVELGYYPERRTRFAGGEFAFGLTAASLGLCAQLLSLRLLGLALCAGGMLGSIHSVVVDLDATGPGDRLWGAFRGGLRVWAPHASPVRIGLGVDAVASLTRHRFLVRNEPGQVFRQSPVAIQAAVGAGLRF